VNFNSILIGSGDAERLAAYYTKVLGAPAFSEQGYSAFAIGTGWVTVGPHSEVNGPNPTPGRIIWNIETDDVRADFERFKAAGATVVTEPYDFDAGRGSTIATFSDPDGNYFQLMSPMAT
jgi:predicted enzyme related to lactoylglutathione lyase